MVRTDQNQELLLAIWKNACRRLGRDQIDVPFEILHSFKEELEQTCRPPRTLQTSAGPIKSDMFNIDGFMSLTPRQMEVFHLIGDGLQNNEIATLLGLSEGTVKIHITSIFKAMGLRNRTQARLLSELIRRQ